MRALGLFRRQGPGPPGVCGDENQGADRLRPLAVQGERVDRAEGLAPDGRSVEAEHVEYLSQVVAVVGGCRRRHRHSVVRVAGMITGLAVYR